MERSHRLLELRQLTQSLSVFGGQVCVFHKFCGNLVLFCFVLAALKENSNGDHFSNCYHKFLFFYQERKKSSKWNVLLWRKTHAGRKETHKALSDITDKRKSLETFCDAQWTWLVGVWRKLIDSCFCMRVERGLDGMTSSFHLDACLLTLQTEINALKYFLSNFTQKVVSLTRRGITRGLHFWLERKDFCIFKEK